VVVQLQRRRSDFPTAPPFHILMVLHSLHLVAGIWYRQTRLPARRLDRQSLRRGHLENIDLLPLLPRIQCITVSLRHYHQSTHLTRQIHTLLTARTRPQVGLLYIKVPVNKRILAAGTCRLSNSACPCRLVQSPRTARQDRLPDFRRTVPALAAGR